MNKPLNLCQRGWREGGMPVLAAAFFLCAAPAALAANAQVETDLQSSGDVSMFYQALANTGVLGELVAGQPYTVFAPTNASWAQISPHTYPCFYAVQCRPQIAALLRNYIVAGHYSLSDLSSYGNGIQTTGAYRLHIVQNYPGDYTVDGKKILTKNDAGNSIVYRIDGVIANPEDLTPFQTANRVAPAPLVNGSNDRMTETTIIYQDGGEE